MNQETKACKHCQSDIPKKAKVCPQCRRKQGGGLKWAVTVIIVLGLIGNMTNSDTKKETKHEDSKETQEANAESEVAYEKNKKDVKKKRKKKTKAEGKKNDSKKTSTQTEDKPNSVSIENSTVLYYMDLYENYENYNGQYVTISAPISYANEDTVDVNGDIEGVTGMINITLLEPRNDLKEGDFITVTGKVEDKAMGYLYIKDANISQTGDGSAQTYNQQKVEYDALSAQKQEEEVADFKASCEVFDYEDVLRNPDGYKDKNCVVSGTVDQIIEGWFDSFSIFVNDAAGNKWGCVYSYKEGETRLLEGDNVTIYGKCQGTDNTKTLLGQQVTLPRIDAEYIN